MKRRLSAFLALAFTASGAFAQSGWVISSGGGGTVDLATGVTGVLPGANGGTGVANTGKTITLAGNLVTTGAFNTTFAQAATTTVTLPSTSATMARTDAGQTFTGVQNFGAGSAATPSLSIGNATTGLYSVSTTGVGIAVNGVVKIDWGITAGSGTSTVGSLTATGTLTANGGDVLASGNVRAGNTTSKIFINDDTGFSRDAIAIMGLRGSTTTTPAALSFYTYGASPPAAGAASIARLYVDTSGGKDRLVVVFSSGAAQVIATQP